MLRLCAKVIGESRSGGYLVFHLFERMGGKVTGLFTLNLSRESQMLDWRVPQHPHRP